MRKLFLLIALITGAIWYANATNCLNGGTGADGIYHATTSTTLAGGTYNFTSFTIDAGVIVTVSGAQPLTIYCTGNVVINGTLSANGGNGADGVTSGTYGTGGIGVAGGGNGGDGSYSSSTGPLDGLDGAGSGGTGTYGSGWSGGGGAGYATLGDSSGGVGGFAGAAYSDVQLTGLYSGSGGGGGSGGYSCGGGGGGAGGGLIYISTTGTLTIGASGGITCNGGNGGSDGTGNCGGGGGGSGGTIWLSAHDVSAGGLLSATGGLGGNSTISGSPYFGAGANAADGRIRIDYGASYSNTGTSAPAVGYSLQIPLLSITINATDTVVCFGSQVTLTGTSGATTYTWDNSVTDGVAFTPSSTTTYTVTGTDGSGCSATASTTITVDSIPVVTATTNNSTICNGTNVTLTGGGASTYTWDNSVTDGVAFAPASTATYSVTGTDANNCSATASTTVTVNQLPSVTANADNNTICNGNSVTLTGGGASTYTWDNSVTDGVAFAPASTATYSVTGTDTNNCSATASTTVTVNTPSASSLTENICPHASYDFNGQILTSRGTYIDTLVASNGCDSIVTLTLQTNDINDSVLVAGNTCSVVQVNAGYQWIDCNTGQPVNGATLQTFFAPQNGSYACIIYKGNCTDTTQCVSVTGVGVADIHTVNNVFVYPNPANNIVTVTAEQLQHVTLYNSVGQLVADKACSASVETFDISMLPAGLYHIRVFSSNAVSVLPLLKQ